MTKPPGVLCGPINTACAILVAVPVKWTRESGGKFSSSKSGVSV